MAIPLLESCDIAGKDVTGDALLTQLVQELKAHCALANYVVDQDAHYWRQS